MLDLTSSNLVNQGISWEREMQLNQAPGFTHVKEDGNVNPESKAVLTTVVSLLLAFDLLLSLLQWKEYILSHSIKVMLTAISQKSEQKFTHYSGQVQLVTVISCLFLKQKLRHCMA